MSVEQLAVLYCDVSRNESSRTGYPAVPHGLADDFGAVREMASAYGGREARTAAGGWAATFDATVEALLCAREVSGLSGWRTGGPSLSGGLSAGEVIRRGFEIGGSSVSEAIALCHQARPRQVLVADPLRVLVAPATAGSFAAARGPARGPAREATTTGPQPTARGTMRLTILGWVQLESGDPAVRQAAMAGSQSRAVLSMLALRGGPVHKDELAELIWPGSLPDHWEGALRGLITKIRRFFAAADLPATETVVGQDGFYELRLPPGVTVDRDEAVDLIAAAETALAERRPAEASQGLRRAAGILERRLLSGQDNAWFDQVRAELAQDRLRALELWTRADLAAGNLDGAKRAAEEALALDPYRESSFRLLMEAHDAAGSRGEALRTYERCRRMLGEELGVAPADQTQRLYLQLLG